VRVLYEILRSKEKASLEVAVKGKSNIHFFKISDLFDNSLQTIYISVGTFQIFDQKNDYYKIKFLKIYKRELKYTNYFLFQKMLTLLNLFSTQLLLIFYENPMKKRSYLMYCIYVQYIKTKNNENHTIYKVASKMNSITFKNLKL
jgi:hypothetical protein